MREVEVELGKSDYREFRVIAVWRALWKVAICFGILLSALNVLQDYCGCVLLTFPRILADVVSGFGVSLLFLGAIVGLTYLSGGQTAKYVEHLGPGTRSHWDEKGIHIASRYYSALYPWSIPRQWLETRSLIVVYLSILHPLLFPKRLFDAAELDQLRARLRASGIKEMRRF